MGIDSAPAATAVSTMRRVALSVLTGLALLVATVAKSAVQLNKDALALAYKNELRQALPIFKQAARKDPTNAEYLNNIGVTEMRLGKLDEAKRYFELALEHSPNNEDARLNLAELLDFIQKRDRIDNGDVVQKEYEKHKTIPLPHIHIDDFYKPEYTSFHTGKRPFILQGLASGWKGAEQWDLDYLEALFPNSTVDFYPHNVCLYAWVRVVSEADVVGRCTRKLFVHSSCRCQRPLANFAIHPADIELVQMPQGRTSSGI